MKRTEDKRHTQVGIDRLVSLDWMNRTALLVAAGNDSSSIKSTLQLELKDSFRSDNTEVRGSIDKTITILMRVWLNVPSELESFRLEGLQLLSNRPQADHIAVHWGMIMAVYPFWMNVATQVGRLLKLQDAITPAQVQRRVREQYGERETVARRARYVLRSFVEWGLLSEETKGVYRRSSSIVIDDKTLVSWMVEAALHAKSNGSSAVRDLLEGPWFFPFRLRAISGHELTTASPRLDCLRDGFQDEMVVLRV